MRAKTTNLYNSGGKNAKLRKNRAKFIENIVKFYNFFNCVKRLQNYIEIKLKSRNDI